MAVATWVLLGVLLGIIATVPIRRPAKAIVLDVVSGVLGSTLGGWLFNAHRGLKVTTLTLNSVLLAILGAVACLTLYHSITYRPTRSTR
jgi:uncharacterized membrane protein YeaQ/YmgE (transglycosylase-associated protein family)